MCVRVLEEDTNAASTKFSSHLIAAANEVRQELAELVNTWRACQIGRPTGRTP